jgi:hypothetical protein
VNQLTVTVPIPGASSSALPGLGKSFTEIDLNPFFSKREDIMGLSVAEAYTRLKQLENTNQITLPTTLDTVEIGTIDPKAGTFTYAVPTVVQTTVIPPNPQIGQKTNTIINVTVGVVSTKAVDLRLKFAVIPQPSQSVEALARTAAPAPAALTPATGAASVATAAKLNAGSIGVVGGVLGETNGGTTIQGFPTIVSQANQIILDAGLVCSQATGAVTVTPPVSNFEMTVDIPGKQPILVRIFILRPPVVGMGAFTIPALPMTIVYAPPQGKLQKNTATYSDTKTLTRTVTSAITNTTSTKTVQAYSAADLIGKVAAAITTVLAVVGTGGAGAAGGASVAGAFAELGQALFGGAKDASDSTADATKQVSSDLSLVSNILTAVDSSAPPMNTGTITVENDQSLQLSVSSMSQFMSDAGLGPGAGDRIVYLSNVKAVWMAANGEVGIHIFGFDAIGANAVQDLQQEQQSLQNGGKPRLGLDLDTIKMLLSQDPLTATRKNVAVLIGAPLVGPPRFVPANPPGRTGSGTGPQGDVVQVIFDTTTETRNVTTNSTTQITDMKPGWAGVLFGADDNEETTTTATFTMTTTTDDKTDDKVASTITFFSQGVDDPYDVKIFYDCTFGTYMTLNSDSPALRGVSVVLENNEAALTH